VKRFPFRFFRKYLPPIPGVLTHRAGQDLAVFRFVFEGEKFGAACRPWVGGSTLLRAIGSVSPWQ
jgi:hypothetical protein